MYRVLFLLLLCTACRQDNSKQETKVLHPIVEEGHDDFVATESKIPSPDSVQYKAQMDSADALLAMHAKTNEAPILTPKSAVKPVAKIAFKESSFDFGELKAGEKTSHSFVFENTGDGPLEIKNVNVSCGCTFPSYPFLAIAPGETGHIDLTYNSVGKEGHQRATATVFSNDPSHREVVLSLTGVVVDE